ncbi:MAG: hypothetical protein R3E77_12340 [Steroidobacteraceae bacterium]
MAGLIRRAGFAALIVAAAYALQLANMFYFEPRMGFATVGDFFDTAKLQPALTSTAWQLNAWGQLLAGFAFIFLGQVVAQLVRERRPVGAGLTAVAGGLCGGTTMLVAILSGPGALLPGAFAAANPGNDAAFVGTLVIVNYAVTTLGAILLGWFIVQLGWALRKRTRVPYLFTLFGLITGLANLNLFRSQAYYPLCYILVFLWAVALAFVLFTRAQQLAEPPED